MAENESSTPKTPREAKVADAARLKALRENSAVGKQLGGFMDFVRTQGIVGLAVGLAIGTQANSTVKSIVDGFITPVVGFIIGSPKGLAAATWNVIGKDTKTTDYWLSLGNRQLVIGWGGVLSSLITLLAVAAVIYFVVKGFGFGKLDKKKDN
ncbi:MAG: putative Large-conductance mechanosensitive channel-like protein [Candidatus Saccharibacteria bacterium]|nr:putative Large-conductance mechanosensitive channel-like protein [Candidatus Saccharibacteria bacterium]